MMIYQTREGISYNIAEFSSDARASINWLLHEYNGAVSWLQFQQRTAHGVIKLAKKEAGSKWGDHSLYKIQLDLVGNVEVRSGELTGEISNMFDELPKDGRDVIRTI